MSHYRSTIPKPELPRAKHLRVFASMPFLALYLAGCTSSLARLPSEPFELRTQQAFAQNPLSVGKHFPSDDEELPQLIAEPDPQTGYVGGKVGAGTSDTSTEDPATELININAVNAPLGALLHALATEAQIQFHAVGPLEERISLKVEQQSLAEVLEQMADQAGFSWELVNKTLTIWSGKAYVFSYAIDYLNIDRSTQSSVGLATQVGTINASDGAGTSSIANSSQTRVENKSEHLFWGSLQADVEKLVSQQRSSALQARSGPLGSADSPSSRPAESADPRPEFSINREVGLLNLFASPAIHRSVKRYLEQLHDSARRQVLIEATVVEVALSDSFEAGVDWQLLANGVSGVSAIQALVGAPFVDRDNIDRVVAPSGLISMVQPGSRGDVSATLSLLEQFGDVRILSRPRIIALNNQSSVLKVVDNRVYFTVNIERRQTETRDEIVTESEIHTVPVGLVMNVTPQISKSGAVMLNIRPTLSRILGFVNDPNPELAEANVRNGVPEIQVREMESMLRVQSGNMAIIGGLMQETTEGDDAQLPGLGNVPLIKHLFSKKSRKRRQTELLIVLRPTVIAADTQVIASR
ncbi:pilus (MSHA type) biogenesis protein MshL [Granulosicoccus antarcticus]|uniref:Type II secretion system protein D n=1 Tax=Granulosicoccus antarcticus IMCC3135 TaxID=1192854 RepID=A0A2Z2NXS0_9GAMM|nr:pilus (MSHA type) biogenesis protein MshL [Granulosicoccus antarcticus]ASJ76242.1 Type II secretion system protein D [Granulosicoccus antarcticus IMCC3135]